MVCCFLLFLVLCVFKQKTAYEMRISDWSSDVCSSDLERQRAVGQTQDIQANALLNMLKLGPSESEREFPLKVQVGQSPLLQIPNRLLTAKRSDHVQEYRLR